MKLFKILALIALTSACAPAFISISGSIPPEIQQQIAPAQSAEITYNFINPIRFGSEQIKIAPLWDIELNPISPLKSALRELVETKYVVIHKSDSTTNAIAISVPDYSYNVSRSGGNPTALHINMRVRADIRNGDMVYSRTFRHKVTVAIIGSNSTFFIRAQDSINSMIIAFVIDLDKFIEASKI